MPFGTPERHTVDRHRRPGGAICERLPTSFLSGEDQGTLIVNVQLPPGATQERTRAVMEPAEGFMLKQPEVQSMSACSDSASRAWVRTLRSAS